MNTNCDPLDSFEGNSIPYDSSTGGYDDCLVSSRTPKRAKATAGVGKDFSPLTRTPSIKHFPRRKKRSNSPHGAFSTPPISPVQFTDSEFSFSSLYSPSDTSDLESLPDLTEDNSTFDELNCQYSGPNSIEEEQFLRPSGASIFEIPEIVNQIVYYVDAQNTVLPQENTPVRRRPLSYNHALLIHGSKEQADIAYKEYNANKAHQYTDTFKNGSLYSCMLVNKLFYNITKEVLNKKFFFSDEEKLYKYLKSPVREKTKPQIFVLHKLFSAKQNAISELVKRVDFSNVESIELYMCPKLLPTKEFFVSGKNIKSIVITGSKTVDDNFLKLVSENCPNLELLDIRACELISDTGLYRIAKNCSKLTEINFGRKHKGHLVTDSSISPLILNNKQLKTVGLAGCHITDKSMWELAFGCSNSLERLSLNSCQQVTDASIPIILQNHYFPNLSVLELRQVQNITLFKPIIEFKRRQEYKGISFLIEVCERLCLLMREHELAMDKAISQRIFKDILEWANTSEDGDVPFQHFIKSRATEITT